MIILQEVRYADPTIYIPLIYADKTMHEHIKNTLLKKEFAFSDPMQDKINELEFPMSITTTSDGESIHYILWYIQQTSRHKSVGGNFCHIASGYLGDLSYRLGIPLISICR